MARATAASATAAAGHQAEVVAVTPVRYVDAGAAVRNFTSEHAVASSPKITASLNFDFDVPIKAMKNLPNQGTSLLVDTASGLLDADNIHYSHPLPPDATGCQFPTAVRMTLDHDAETALIVRTPVKALKSELAYVYPGSQTKENPNGFIALRFNKDSNTAEFNRVVSDGQKDFMNEFPGQTTDVLHHFVTMLPNSTDALLTVNPPSVVAHFYNSSPANQAHLATQEKMDARGRVYVPKDAAAQALTEAVAAMDASVNYSNLSSKDAIHFEIGTPQRKTLGTNQKATAVGVGLSEVYKKLPAYTAATAANSVTRVNAHIESTAALTFSGTMEIDFYNVQKNFKIM